MPKQTRWMIKRTCDQALNDVTRAQQNLVTLGAMFEEHHPELYVELCEMVAALEPVKGTITEFRDKI